MLDNITHLIFFKSNSLSIVTKGISGKKKKKNLKEIVHFFFITQKHIDSVCSFVCIYLFFVLEFCALAGLFNSAKGVLSEENEYFQSLKKDRGCDSIRISQLYIHN